MDIDIHTVVYSDIGYAWATLSENPVSRELNVDSSRGPHSVYSIDTDNTP